MTGALQRLRHVSRSGNWWYSKIPLMLTAAFSIILLAEVAPRLALPRLAVLLVAICAVAAYGHVINDTFDIEEDRLAGKPNTMAARHPVERGAMALAFAVVSLGVPWLAGLSGLALGLLIANLLLPTLYSLPAIRFKERGGLGVLADAGAAHALPALLFSTAFWPDGASPPLIVIAATISATVYSFFAGLRGIIVHQVHDQATDTRAGVKTFALAEGVGRSRGLVFRWLLPVELAALATLLVCVLPRAPLLAIALVIHASLEALKIRNGWRLPLFHPTSPERERYFPILNNELYEVWLPLALAIQLATESPAYALLPVVFVGLFYANVRTRLEPLRALRLRVEGVAPARPRLPHLAQRPASLRGNAAPARLDELNVILGATYWTLNGVNVFSANLAQGLQSLGARVRVLLTEENTRLVHPNEVPMKRTPGVVFEPLPTRRADGWGTHWGGMLRFLEEQAPCVYIPNSDWRHSCVTPLLSNRVAVAGVVHSDDPLHYDHVGRLGRHWDAIVCVSDAVAARTRELQPGLSHLVQTIPIGVPVPDVPPTRTPVANAPVSIIYNGLLKQHQKRVLDLPEVVRACVQAGVPVRLTIAGGGPDENELRKACADLESRGLITFAGVVPRDEVPARLAAHDVFIMTSEFEGMPNALLEAMGQGCVPVVTAVASGATQVLRPGENGLLVNVGDYAGFADRLALLQRDPALRARLSVAAHATARDGYRVERMVGAYAALFQVLQGKARSGALDRIHAPMSPPPKEVAGVSLFPLALPYEVPGVGRFLSRHEADAFRLALGALVTDAPNGAPASAMRRNPLDGVRIIFGTPIWARNGINETAADLIRVLRERSLDARILLTEEATDLVTVNDPRMPRVNDVPIDDLPVSRGDGWGAHWGAMIRYLEDRAPCVYLSAYDWRHATVLPRLSNRVRTVGIVPSIDALYLDHVRRVSKHWDAAVAMSTEVADTVEEAEPQLAGRLVQIDRALPVPSDPPRRPQSGPLRVVAYADGRTAAALRAVVEALTAQDSAIEVTVAPDTAAIDTQPDLLVRHHVLLTSRSISQRELFVAKGYGCIPVFVGETAETVRQLLALRDLEQRSARALSAYDEATNEWYSGDHMAEHYIDLFRRIQRGELRRPRRARRDALQPPPSSVAGIDIFPVPLPHHFWGVGRFPSREDAEAFCRSLGPHATAGQRAVVFLRRTLAMAVQPDGRRA